MLLPGVERRRRAVRAWARGALALSAIQVRAEGLEHLPESPPNRGAVLVVANHASYADSILLTAVLPPRFGYAAMRELAGLALLGAPLRRLGAVFVERAGAAGGGGVGGVIQHDKRWMEASDVMPMFPGLVWKIQLEPGLRDSLNASITAALAELRRAGAPLPVGQGWQSRHTLHRRVELRELVTCVEPGVTSVLRFLRIGQDGKRASRALKPRANSSASEHRQTQNRHLVVRKARYLIVVHMLSMRVVLPPAVAARDGHQCGISGECLEVEAQRVSAQTVADASEPFEGQGKNLHG